MEIVGKIIQNLGEISGVSKAGRAWKKHAYVLETQESYPKKIYFDFFGERADQYPLEVGQVIRLSFDIDSREYEGRWYTSVSAWKAEPADSAQPAAAPQQQYSPATAPVQQAPSNFPPAQTPTTLGGGEATDDLPF